MSLPALVWVMKHSEAELGPRLVLFVLAEHAHDDGTDAFPSVETMMQRSRLSRRSVQGALRRLETDGHIKPTGKRDSGTVVYRVVLSAAAQEGGADIAPPAEGGGADFDAPGAQISTRGGADIAPDPSGPKNLTLQLLAGRVPKSVDGKRTTEAERDLAASILTEWNEQTGQRLAAADWLLKLVMRIREHPDLGLDDHAAVIAASLANPWWKGPPTPAVVYGNGGQFERSVLAATPGPTIEKPEQPGRYGRGLTTRQAMGLFGIDGGKRTA